ncbi:hypothetical protein C5167_039324 [Papaver somniferum]|uniref:non-specific serine/threonine protein kinase n=1 Tax=Papaver somniferum TaxID=3469 RepID=A0A4Y7IFA1_PAPSO|nr:hypothetical protein C5167_039324 [Papaver somniferum]
MSGQIKQYLWSEDTQEWNLFWARPSRQCGVYGICGPFGICNQNSTRLCTCMQGFKERFPEDRNLNDSTGGCKRKTSLKCGDQASYSLTRNMELPANVQSLEVENFEECKSACSSTCSCKAYAYASDGCSLWDGDLLNVQQLSPGETGGRDFYLRLDPSDILSTSEGLANGTSKKNKGAELMTIIISVGTAMIVLGLIIYFAIWRRTTKKEGKNEEIRTQEDLELPLIDLITIETATNYFSQQNKIGEGGFGPVYKGCLAEGQQIAVKRLCKESGQGLNEFKNEIILIAKLQHRNLVKLLGCCIHGDERLLVYEYMPNGSLDYFIFDEKRSTLLDWNKRMNIIMGIARGLLYLHQDSRLRIIHRDLKTSNILLDIDLNPKISDFGMARLFGGDQTEGMTRRWLYVSRICDRRALFSVKSDVFSYGVLVLEMISGKKNRGFSNDSHQLNLLGHAWMLWNEGKALEIIDPCLGDALPVSAEALKCIQVGLLCVQQLPDDRPTMSAVVFMLGSENAVLPEPKEPGFFVGRNPTDTSSSRERNSENQVTISLVEPR